MIIIIKLLKAFCSMHECVSEKMLGRECWQRCERVAREGRKREDRSVSARVEEGREKRVDWERYGKGPAWKFDVRGWIAACWRVDCVCELDSWASEPTARERLDNREEKSPFQGKRQRRLRVGNCAENAVNV